MKKIYILLLLFYVSFSIAYTQELNANVKVSAPRIQTTDPKVFRSMEDDIRKFINNRVWTKDNYKAHEKIKCNFNFTIKKEENSNFFEADLTVSASRPVFGSNYETTLINYIDGDLKFGYLPNDPLNYVQNIYNDRLVSALTFYIYLILGLDGDSFAPNGGTDYFLIAQNIVNTIPGSLSGEGWKASDGNHNRFWLFENIMSPRLRSMRSAWYTYHRLGLDMMSQNASDGRAGIYKALEGMDQAKRAYPGAQWLISFMDAKGKEIIEIFRPADKIHQDNVTNILNRISPTFSVNF